MAIAVATCLVLLGYYAVIGQRYWKASNHVSGLTDQYYSLSANLNGTPQASKKLDEELNLREKELSKLLGNFNFNSDQIMATLVDIARDNNLVLKSATSGDVSAFTRNQVKYQVIPLNLNLAGELTEVYRFLGQLKEYVPVVSIEGIHITGVESQPVVNLQLSFYVLPERVTKS